MARTLGLDLGTNSIGWCLIEDGKGIIKSGVRIFPVGVQEDNFLKSGTEVSKNIGRRMARGARRRRFRFKLRREKLVGLLSEYSMLPGEEEFYGPRELYELRTKGLDKQLSLTQFGRILQLLNKRRGFKSNRKSAATDEAKKEEGIVREKIDELSKEIEKHRCRTVGEYFALLFQKTDDREDWHNPDEAIERIRNRFVGREMYEEEFNKLWMKQAKFYPTVLTDSLKTKIGDETIYYQRNLKSQKGLVGRCRYEPKKRCAQRSSPLFQEFRVWQQLALLRFANGERIGQPLMFEEKLRVFLYLMNNEFNHSQQKKLHNAFRKMLGLSKTTEFNDVPINGNTTYAKIADALGKESFDQLTEAQRFELWHILTYTDNTEKLKAIVRRKADQGILPKMEEEQLNEFAEVNLEEFYGNYSTAVLTKVVPFLRKGALPFDNPESKAEDYENAFRKAGYDPSKRRVNGTLVENDKVRPLLPNELRNPIVQQILSETFRVVNAIIKEYGKPDKIRVELARELKKPKTKREEDRNKAIRKRKLREDYAEFLTKRLKKRIEPNHPEVKKYELWLEMGCEDPKLDNLDSFLKNGRVIDQTKYRLWKECGRISPYDHKERVISLTKLFSAEIEIEHILPYSKTMNSEFGNLTLSWRDINQEKGNKLAFDYLASKGEAALELFKKRVVAFSNEAKRRRFLSREIPDDFLNSQLTNTSYAARELAWRLEEVLPPLEEDSKLKPRVQVVNGFATGTLRRLWGLNAILSKGDIDTKNRGDHRHHAIDGLVVACTSPSLVHTLATYSKFDAMNKLENSRVTKQKPWNNFLKSAEEAINEIIVSYRNQKRLVGKRPNKIKVKRSEEHPKGYIVRPSLTIRGPLHEETIYGSIELIGEETYVTRWPLEKFKDVRQFEKVVDQKVREVLLKRVKKYKGEIKKAFAENVDDPVLMYSKPKEKRKDGKEVIVHIKKVRVINPSKNLIEVRPKTFVESGSNYAIAIYEDQETKERDYLTIPFWNATRFALSHSPLFPREKDGKPLLFMLKQKDTVVLYKEHPDEIDWDDMDYLRNNLFRVRKLDVAGQIFLDYLYAAKIEKEDRNRLFFQIRPNTLKAVPIEVDILGRIIKKVGMS